MDSRPTVRTRFTLTGDNPLVDDHRVHGVRTLPGVTFLDVVYRMLAAQDLAAQGWELRNVLFTEPVVTVEGEDRQVDVELTWRSTHYQVLAHSRRVRGGVLQDGAASRHLEAELHLGPAAQAAPPPPPAAGPAQDVERAYAFGRAAGILHRSFMKCGGVFRLRLDGLSAELALGAEARSGSEAFLLHPALLDASTMQSYLLAFTGEESSPRPLIPFHIGSFRAAGPLGEACTVELRVRGGAVAVEADVLNVDIDLYDARGGPAARFERLTLKRIRESSLITRLVAPARVEAATVKAAPDEVVTVESTPVAGGAPSAGGPVNSAPAVSAFPAAGPASAAPLDAVRDALVGEVRALLGDSAAQIDSEHSFYSLGLGSAQLLQLVRALETRWRIELYPTLLFEHTTVDAVSAYLLDLIPADALTLRPEAAEPSGETDPGDKVGDTVVLHGKWSPCEVSQAPATPGLLLLVDDRADLAEALRAAGTPVFHVRPGASYRISGPEQGTVRPDSFEDWRAVLSVLADGGRLPDAVVYRGDPSGVKSGELSGAVERACRTLLMLVRALLDTPGWNRLPLVCLAPAEDEAAAVLPAALSGVARTARIEQPRLRLKVVELGARATGAGLAALVRRELAEDDEVWVRHENGRRLARRHRQLRLDGVAGPPLRDRGVCLVSGGNGGLAVIIAEYLAREARARLVLFGRSELDPAVARRLRARENETGARIDYLRGDVTDPRDVARIVAEARSRHGAIHGVVHAAAVLDDCLLVNKSADGVSRVLAPKLRGAQLLDQETRGEPLDFFALFSSVTGDVGNAGQADYAAANAALTAYARSRAAAGRAGTSVAFGWPLWAEGGMAAGESTFAQLRRSGQVPLGTAEGVRVFGAGLRCGEPELLVMRGDRRRILASFDPAVGDELAEPVSGPEPAAVPLIASAETAPTVRAESAPAARAGQPTAPRGRDIAVIGMAGRYPGADDLGDLWDNLVAGRDCIIEIPAERWPLDGFFAPERGTPGRSYSRWGGFVAGADSFDPRFFQITPREAEAMDPQERLFLETVWHTMEDAACTRADLAGWHVGVFVGVMFNQYQMLGSQDPERLGMLPSSFSSSVANRVSHHLDFHGPSIAVDTMCSSSLTAIHLACRSLLTGDCDVAFAGGVNVITHPYKYVYLSRVGFLSTDGRCRSFGEGGDGYVPGEGVGALLLKPLDRALADGDRVHGVIRGSAVNHGGRSGGFFVPNPVAQADLIGRALRDAAVEPETIGYLEAHGPGTALGDPIEMSALARAFGAAGPRGTPVPIGSVKSSIGHLESAAGVAGLSKVLLQLRHRTLVPSLHADRLNPQVDWAATRFRVQREAAAWEAPAAVGGGVGPRRAGISAFGAGGANGHVIVEEFADPRPAAEAAPGPYLVLLSARHEENLRELARRHLARFAKFAPPAEAAVPEPVPVARLAELAAELFGLSSAVLEPGVALEEWGLDAADLSRLEQAAAERFELGPGVLRLEAGSTLAGLAGLANSGLAGSGLARGGAGDGGVPAVPTLAEIAYTSQVGRDALAERLAVVVADREELRAVLGDFLDGRPNPRLYRATARRGGADASAQVDEGLRRPDLHALADLWTNGAAVDWAALHPRRLRKAQLPLYPFTRERFWAAAPERESAPGGRSALGGGGMAAGSVDPATAFDPAASSAAVPPAILEHCLAPVWRLEPAPPTTAETPAATDGGVLILYPTAAAPLAAALAALVRLGHGREPLCAELGDRNRRRAARDWELDARAPEALGALADAADLRTVYFLGGLSSADQAAEPYGPEEIDRAETTGVLALYRCARYLAAQGARSRVLDWRIVTSGAFPAAGAPVTNPAAGALAGLARVLEHEYPRWTAPVLDLAAPLPAPGDPRWSDLARAVTAEPPARGVRVALRAGLRYQESIARVPWPAGADRLRAGATYVVIGGAGGIGFETARRLVRDLGARVALVGRGELSPGRADDLRRADPDGTRLMYVRADAAEPDRLAEAVAAVRGRFGPVSGVFHCALSHRSALIRDLDEDTLREGLRAKSGVAAAAAAAFRGEPLDFMVLFSSVQSFLGDPGLAHYAAGSAFLDAFAHALDRHAPYAVRCVDWGYWGGAGAVADDRSRALLLGQGFEAIEPEAGWAALRRVLAGDAAQVAVLRARDELLARLGVTGPADPHPAKETEPVTIVAFEGEGEWESLLAPTPGDLAAVDRFHALDDEMTLIADGWTLRILDAMGVWGGADGPDGVSETDAIRRAGVTERYHRLLGAVLRRLHAAGLLYRVDGRYTPDPAALASARRSDHAATLAGLAEKADDLAVFPKLLLLCLGRYPQLLRGELLATDLLFPRSGTGLMEAVYKGNPISEVYNEALNRVVLAHVQERLPGLAAGERIRIVEVGSGTGGTSAGLLRILKPYGDRLEYVYTDLSAAFLAHGRREYGDEYPFVRFRRLDANRDLAGQGYAPGTFDLVVAANVIHATRDVEQTLRVLKAALRPGGRLVLNELTSVTVQSTLTYGLFDGWWDTDDPARRLPDSPLLDAAGWGAVAAALGYREFTAVPGAAWTTRNFQHVLVAAGDGPAPPPAASAEVRSRRAVLPAGGSDGVRALLEHDLRMLAAEASGLTPEELDPRRDLGEFGFDSVSYSLLADRLNDRFVLSITPAIFYETATLNALIDKLAADHPDLLAAHYAESAAGQSTIVPPATAAAPLMPATAPLFASAPAAPVPPAPASLPATAPASIPGSPSALGSAPRPNERGRGSGHDAPVAIIGLAGILPGSSGLDDFWRHLLAGDELVTPIPADRPALRAVHRRGGFIAGVDRFDPLFFDISPREAAAMDPQQRLVLQSVWTALEDAGIAPGGLAGSDTGVFVGVGSNDYQELQLAAGAADATYGVAANTHSILVNRISYLLDLHGPSEPVNTACSSSLVALHRAAAAVRAGDCELAVAGGVNVILSPHNYELLDGTGMLSPEGVCRAFDGAADGFVRSEGVGVVVLTTAERAAREGHRVHAWLRGSAVNHGGRARSLTAPNPASQSSMLVRAYRRAGVGPDAVSHIEAHGTGTELGDPVEVNGLKAAFAELGRAAGTPAREASCGLGSVKSNVGHLEAAAGIAGVLKVLLAMRHGVLPPSLHVRTLNPYLQLEGSPFHVITRATPWQPLDAQGTPIPRIAGVSSFGYGGVNAHVVLEQAADVPRVAAEPSVPLYVVSARTESALRAYADLLAGHLTEEPDIPLADVAHTLRVGRDAREHRLAIVARTRAELVQALRRIGQGLGAAPESGIFAGSADAARPYGAVPDGERVEEALRRRDPAMLAVLWTDGAEIDWRRVEERGDARLTSLPTYPFADERHWFDADADADADADPDADLAVGGGSAAGPSLASQDAEHTGNVENAETAETAEHPEGTVDDARLNTDPELSALATAPHAGTDQLYTPTWELRADPEPDADSAPLPPGRAVWVVETADSAALAGRLAGQLADRHGRGAVVRVRADGPSPLASVAGLPDPAAVYFLAGVRRPFALGPGEQCAELAVAEGSGVLALFRLVRGLLARPGGGPLTLAVVTADATPAGGRPVRNPHSAHLWGFARSVRRECPDWRVALLDLAWDGLSGDLGRAARSILAAAARPGAELASDGGRLLAPALRPVVAGAAHAAPPIRGVHLVIGGAGDIGADFARHLVDHYPVRVALVGRRPLDATVQARLDRIDPGGARVRYLRADAREPDQLRAAAEAAARRLGPVTAVIHAASVLHDQALHSADEEAFREGLESKTRTTAAVVDVFGAHALDFLLLLSSVQSFLGNPGQAGYAAACTFQDAFAQALAPRLPFPVRVVNLGPWATSRSTELHRDRLLAVGAVPVTPAEGVRAVLGVLGDARVQTAFVSGDAAYRAALGVVGASAGVGAGSAVGSAVRPPDRLAWEKAFHADVHALVCDAVKLAPTVLAADAVLSRFGFDSLAYTRLSQTFNAALDLDITPAFFFGTATSDDVAVKTARSFPEELTRHYATDPRISVSPPEPVALATLVRAPLDDAGPASVPGHHPADAIAIVGMAGRLPGSDDLAQFWAHLAAGDDLVTEIPADRWDWRSIHGEPLDDAEFKTTVKWGGFMRRADEFDPLFFGISPREAEAMDPQHRLFLEAAWGCVEDAGIRPASLAGSSTAVFAGVCTYDYFEIQHAFGTPLDGYNAMGRAHALVANRVSYLLDLRGPSEAIDTACSSSLVAVHRGVEAILNGDCELAIAGGVQVLASPTLFVDMSRGDMLSPNGRCKPFDAAADGIARGEGVGAVLLKRLTAAVADGDVIHGVIRGSAVNHGGRTNSLSAPNPDAQAAVIVRAHERAGTDPRTIDYVETHGTGTALGDPVEIDGLKSAFATLGRAWGAGPGAELPGHIALGAVKSNTGHLEAGAGIAGLIKALLALRHGLLPRTLHLTRPNPHLRLEGSPFRLLAEAEPWERRDGGAGTAPPRRAGVSSFGLGGVNAHVVLEEYLPEPRPEPLGADYGVFPLSARDGDRLRAYAARIAAWLADPPAHVTFPALLRTAQAGRTEFDTRLAVVAHGLDDLRTKLARWADGEGAVDGVFLGAGRVQDGPLATLLDGVEGDEFLNAVVAAGRWDKLARLWAGGAAIDWSRLWPDPAVPRRVSVPGYPFARERYWVRPGEHFDAAPAPLTQAAEISRPVDAGVPQGVGLPDPEAVAVPTPVAQASWQPDPTTGPGSVVPGLSAALEEELATLLAQHLGVDRSQLRADRSLVEYGVDSLGLRRAARALNARYGISIPARLFTTSATVAVLAQRLLETFPHLADAEDTPSPSPAAPAPHDAFRGLLRDLQEGRITVAGALDGLTNGVAR